MEYTKIKCINEYVSKSITPSKTPNTIFEMYSVPIFETGHPEYLRGNEIASSKIVVQKNDILLCKINPKINRVWVVMDESDKMNIASSEWIVIRNSDYNPEFLAWYFRTPKFQRFMTSEVTGIGGSLTRAQPKRVAEYPVPILERKKQDEIVGALNKLQSIITHRKQQLEKLDELVKARFVEMFDGNDFEYDRIGNVIIQQTQVEKITHPELEKYVTVGIHGTGARQRIIKDGKTPVPFSGYRVKKGEFIYSRIDARNGAFAILSDELDGAVVSKDFPVFIIDTDKIQPEFLLFSVLQENFINQIRQSSFGATNRQRIKEEIFSDYKIKLPSLNHQEQFADFVKQVDKSKLSVQKALDKAQLLFDALMQEYFG